MTAKKVAATLVVAAIFGTLALRPLLANPALADAVQTGTSDWRLLLVAPLVFVSLAIVILRLKASNTETDWEPPRENEIQHNSWADERAKQDVEDDGVETSEPQPSVSILSGQGGSRNRDFEIENRPPDAELSHHLEHLQAQLADDRELAADLQTLEEVVDEVEGDRQIPRRCPHEHCDARWSERSVLGRNTNRYELLDEQTVVCLECERTYLSARKESRRLRRGGSHGLPKPVSQDSDSQELDSTIEVTESADSVGESDETIAGDHSSEGNNADEYNSHTRR